MVILGTAIGSFLTAIGMLYSDVGRAIGILGQLAMYATPVVYLIGFRSADEIRNRLAKAREETDRRLRSKGIER